MHRYCICHMTRYTLTSPAQGCHRRDTQLFVSLHPWENACMKEGIRNSLRKTVALLDYVNIPLWKHIMPETPHTRTHARTHTVLTGHKTIHTEGRASTYQVCNPFCITYAVSMPMVEGICTFPLQAATRHRCEWQYRQLTSFISYKRW